MAWTRPSITTGCRELRQRGSFEASPAVCWGLLRLSGGTPTALLGVALHFTIAIGAAAVFYAACFAIPALLRKPWITGPAYGLVVYSVMHYIVVPLSLVRHRTVPMAGWELADQLFSHMFFVGLPIALMARRSART